MAENLDVWLNEKLYEEELTEEQRKSRVLVVAMIGKEVADNTKGDLLNSYLGKQIFLDRWIYDAEQNNDGMATESSTTSEISIDVYFDSEESILWLLLNGVNDVAIQHFLFTSEHYKKMSFFEKLAAVEQQQLQALALLFQLSHALIFLDQGCRFDLDWISTFKQLNRIRHKLTKRLRQSMASIPESELGDEFPRILFESGRLALPPRLLFCFYRNPLRTDLNPTKKKELLEKMEKCLENQIANLLKQHGILDNRFPDNALGQITIASGAPFVYCFNHSETPIDQNHELAMALFGHSENGSQGGVFKSAEEVERIIVEFTEPKKMDKEKLDPSNYNFHYFLHKALTNMRKGGGGMGKSGKSGAQPPMDLPTIDQFVKAAKIMKKCVEEEWAQTEPKATPELSTIESLIDAAIHSAGAVYTRQLALQPEVTGGGDSVFSKLEHDYTMKMALDYLNRCCPKAAGSLRREQMVDQLRAQCRGIWTNGHQRCEQRSLTGQLCHFMVNHHGESLGGSTGLNSRNRSGSGARSGSSRKQHQQHRTDHQSSSSSKGAAHCSGVKTFAMCNCGLSRRIRTDPFTLKEANFNFYAESDFNLNFGLCCAQLDKYQFKLFDPASAEAQMGIPNENAISHQSDETAKMTNRLFEMLAPKGKTEKQTTLASSQHHNPDQFDDELAAALGMDPSEFNVRFFDNADGGADEHDHEEGEEALQLANKSDEQNVVLEEVGKQSDSPVMEGAMATQEDLEEENEDDEEEEEGVRRKNILPDNSTEEEEDEDEEEANERNEEAAENKKHLGHRQQPRSPPSTVPPSSSGDSPEPPEIGHYLDEYDLHLSRGGVETNGGGRRDQRRASTVSVEHWRGQYIDHVPHTSASPHLLPLFPSWAIVCMGHSSVYNHSTGIRSLAEGNTRFRNGSEFLLPWSVELVVNTEQWVRELQYIGVNPSERTMRNMQQGIQRGRPESKEKVKLFIGFDYECPRGHRFMVGEVGKPLRHRKAAGQLKQDAAELLASDLPIWMVCPCKKEPRTSAQLMRIHVVTPKAPVSVRLQPLIQMIEDEDGFFFPGAMECIELGWAKYYVCRLPYAYVGPSGKPTYRPSNPEYRGLLLRQCVAVSHLPIQ